MADELPEVPIKVDQLAPAPSPPEPPPSPPAQGPHSHQHRKLPRKLLQEIRGLRKLSEQSLPTPLTCTPSGAGKPRTLLPGFLQSHSLGRRRLPSITTAEPTTPFTPGNREYGTLERDLADKAIKTGNLLKTSSSHNGACMGPPRERRFRLTEEGLEYFQHFSQVKVRRSFPLTSIEKIEYEPDSKEPGPRVFMLIFPTHIMTLQANSTEDAKDWVEKIEQAWKMWLPASAATSTGPITSDPRVATNSGSPLTADEPIERAIEEKGEEEGEGEKQVEEPTVFIFPTVAASPKVEDRPIKEKRKFWTMPVLRRSLTWNPDLRQKCTMDLETYNRRKGFGRRASLFKKVVKLAPRLEKSSGVRCVRGPDETCEALHEDYAMIKYPRGNWAFPSEKLFKVDKDNLLVLWRRSEAYPFRHLSLHRVLEIREGQQTATFDKYPYDDVWDQSFSLMFEEMKKGGKYVGLTSLDLICDTEDSFNEWIKGLRTLVPGFQTSCFRFQFDNTDPTIMYASRDDFTWMKQLWACHASDHEITEEKAIKLAQRLKPTLTLQEAMTVIKEAHTHQLRHTFNYGNALRWDGFVAIFSLLCGTPGKLFHLFQKYAKKYPQLGMTSEEVKEFLINECYWDPELCTENKILMLIHHHDYHHRAFKKFVAQNRPFEFQIVIKLLSYGGFLSFLRSKDNSAVNIEHNSVHQDMNQPMSHYFINSSHNTYLEEDQLYGRSSTDAYVRTLLQGCRCVEIDCWDDSLRVVGLGEPIVYHGFTLTTKLPFKDVIQTIEDYAFNFSSYPVIVSIENHCSKAQQVKMAQIFEEVMGDHLVQENLVESEGRDRLPSPQELQGKILLKGSYRKIRGRTASKKQFVTHSSSSSQFSLHSCIDPVNSNPGSDRTKTPDQDLESNGVTYMYEQNPSEADINRKQVKKWEEEAKRQGKSKVYKEDQEVATIPKLMQLIPYCRVVSIKPWDCERQLQTTVSEMFSFSETCANHLCKTSPEKMLACSEQQLIRTYPKGVRFDSSNYSPIPMWTCGMQLVALNWQYPDVSMHLNQGLFRLNGGCGYVLKPEVMRRPSSAGEPTPYLPTMTEPHPDVTPVDLEIELLSGQRLCFWKKKCTTLTVEIHTYGIPHDTDKMQPPASAQDNNTFWPQWRERLHVYRKKILMPELCLVYFRVDVVLKGAGMAGMGEKSQLYGQNCISLVSLMPVHGKVGAPSNEKLGMRLWKSGIKFIPLRTPGGEPIPESGLFVQIKKLSSLTQQGSMAEGSLQMDRTDMKQYFGDADVTDPILLRERTSHRTADDSDSARPWSSPPNLESHFEFGTAKEEASWKSKLVRESRTGGGREEQVEVVTEVHGGEDKSSSSEKVVTVTIEPQDQGSFEAAEGEEG